MNITQFENELKTTIDPRLSIRVNPKIPELAGVYFMDAFLIGIPSGQIFDQIRPEYGLPNFSGKFMRHRTRPEALAMVRGELLKMQTDPDYRDAVLGVGEYSAEKLDPTKP